MEHAAASGVGKKVGEQEMRREVEQRGGMHRAFVAGTVEQHLSAVAADRAQHSDHAL